MGSKTLGLKLFLMIYGPLLSMSQNPVFVRMGVPAISVSLLWYLVFFTLEFFFEFLGSGTRSCKASSVPYFLTTILYVAIVLSHIYVLSDNSRKKMEEYLSNVDGIDGMVSFTTSGKYCFIWSVALFVLAFLTLYIKFKQVNPC